MAMKKCKECDTEISSKAKVCPSCGAKLKMGLIKKLLIGFGILMIFVIIANLGDKSTSDKEVSSSSSNQKTPTKAKIEIPNDQQNFNNTVESAKADYANASNELKKTSVRKKRSSNLQKALNGRMAVESWVGRVKNMSTTTEGNAHLQISLKGSSIRVQTWNNELSDLVDESLIKSGSELYNKVADLDKGDLVKFSGSFVSGDNYFIGEQSMTESGAMRNPEFTFIFTNVKKQ